MRGFAVEAGQVFPAIFRNHGGLVVRSGENPERVKRLPEDDGYEFHFVSDVSSQQMAAQKSLRLAEPGQQLGLEVRFIALCVLCFCPTVPHSSDHWGLLQAAEWRVAPAAGPAKAVVQPVGCILAGALLICN